MYNSQLDTFILVADSGSFSKAAERMYISTTAVAKQINLLESSLDLKLFDRTHRGIVLTDSGRSLYSDAKTLISFSEKAVSRAKRAETMKYNVRIGVSVGTPRDTLNPLVVYVQRAHPEMQIQLVPYAETPYDRFGKEIDLILAVCDIDRPADYSVMTLSNEPLCCAVSLQHPMARKEKLEITDLYGQNLMLLSRGLNSRLDLLRDFLEKKHPQIGITDIPFISMNYFNKCESCRHIIFSVKEWAGIHPLLKVIPVAWPYTVPFGILYSKTPSDAARTFIETAAQYYTEEFKSPYEEP